MFVNKQMNGTQKSALYRQKTGRMKAQIDSLVDERCREILTLRISSCTRCFFVSLVEPLGLSFRVQRSLYRISKLGLRCSTAGSIGGSITLLVLVRRSLKLQL
jgi:hypothetical protein